MMIPLISVKNLQSLVWCSYQYCQDFNLSLNFTPISKTFLAWFEAWFGVHTNVSKTLEPKFGVHTNIGKDF